MIEIDNIKQLWSPIYRRQLKIDPNLVPESRRHRKFRRERKLKRRITKHSRKRNRH